MKSTDLPLPESWEGATVVGMRYGGKVQGRDTPKTRCKAGWAVESTIRWGEAWARAFRPEYGERRNGLTPTTTRGRESRGRTMGLGRPDDVQVQTLRLSGWLQKSHGLEGRLRCRWAGCGGGAWRGKMGRKTTRKARDLQLYLRQHQALQEEEKRVWFNFCQCPTRRMGGKAVFPFV